MQEAILLGKALIEGHCDVQFAGADVSDLSVEGIDQPLAHEALAHALFKVEVDGLISAHCEILSSRIAWIEVWFPKIRVLGVSKSS